MKFLITSGQNIKHRVDVSMFGSILCNIEQVLKTLDRKIDRNLFVVLKLRLNNIQTDKWERMDKNKRKERIVFILKWFFFFFNYRLKKQLKAFICHAVTYTNKHWVSKLSLMISYYCQTFGLCNLMTILSFSLYDEFCLQ